jgi:hypothetical protein
MPFKFQFAYNKLFSRSVGQLCKLRADFIGAARRVCPVPRGRLETGQQDAILPHEFHS